MFFIQFSNFWDKNSPMDWLQESWVHIHICIWLTTQRDDKLKLSQVGCLTLILKVFLWGTFPNPPKSSIALLETCPYLQNAPCIFVDLSYSALMACTSCQVAILTHLKRWNHQFPTALSNSKKVPLGGF